VNKEDIEKYLRMVGLELEKQGLTFEILLLGGAVMLIEVGNRDSTEDIDTYFLPDFVAISKAAAVVAEREDLPDSWLSSAAAGFTYIFTKQPPMKLWRKFPGLHVYTASLDYVFVMKIMASRFKDVADITALAQKLGISNQEDTLTLMREYIPQEHLTSDIMDQIRLRFGS